ncbi:Protein BTR1 (Binding to ToMV RNA 1) [Durusdinium trenchii]|uniref:Protein BTR1 (Binding to ToMV RNA 1) n=1 Tax=Durusdinium trenchii TaxID=1381693 RepID=A0ABP0S1H7_9DINO
MGEAAEGAEGEAAEGADAVRIHMVPPCRLIVRATAGARVIGKQGASIKAIRAHAGAHAVRVLQDELPEALKRRQECIVMISCGEESTLRQAVSMVLDRVFDRSGLPDAADRDRERPHVLDVIVPERAGGGIVGQGGERIRAIIEELGCEVQVSREPLAGIAGHKRVKLLARDRNPIEAALWRLQSTLKELVGTEVLTPEHFELREALLSEEDQLRLKARNDAEAAGRGEVPLRVLLGQGEAATVVGKLGANVARLRDLALVSIDDAESPPFDPAERICSAAQATLAQRLRALRLVLGDLATRNAAIAREEDSAQERTPEGLRQVQVRLLFPGDRWDELAPQLETERQSFPEVTLDIQEPQVVFGQPALLRSIGLSGPEEAVALCGWRLHKALEPWELPEPPPRSERTEEEERPKGKGKGKGPAGPRIENAMAGRTESVFPPARPREAMPPTTADTFPRAADAYRDVLYRADGGSALGAQPMLIAVRDFRIAKYLASEAGIASKAGVKLLARPSEAGAPAILEIHGPVEAAATACYFVQLQLWLEGALGKE